MNRHFRISSGRRPVVDEIGAVTSHDHIRFRAKINPNYGPHRHVTIVHTERISSRLTQRSSLNATIAEALDATDLWLLWKLVERQFRELLCPAKVVVAIHVQLVDNRGTAIDFLCCWWRPANSVPIRSQANFSKANRFRDGYP